MFNQREKKKASRKKHSGFEYSSKHVRIVLNRKNGITTKNTKILYEKRKKGK